jgi:dienelactone hydrolase
MDQRIEISVAGVEPNAMIVMNARAQAQDGLWWSSSATFTADANGKFEVSTQAPLEGSYRTRDGMGLFWSMMPAPQANNADRAFFTVNDFSKVFLTQLEALDTQGHVLAAQEIARRYAPDAVRSISMSPGVGILYAPATGSAHPGVIVIGGSDGGYGSPGTAMLLAAHGYCALSLAYFDMPGLPPTLEGIPMEYFADAIAWMRRQPMVDPKFLALYGESRGTEPALWVASRVKGVNAVIVRSPSFVLWGGVAANHLPGKAAWTADGKPLPYIANRISFGFGTRYLWNRLTGNPVLQTPLFIQNLEDFGDTAAAEIAAERIQAPVLMLSGRDDQVWPSSLMAARLSQRLQRQQHPFSDRSIVYDRVGHPIPFAYLPTGGDRAGSRFAVGGTAPGTAEAQANAWPAILQFLDDAVHAH